ncbi:sensor histidine kinase [Arthrospiribacter ruber]|uniref:Histidine kinase n=1 Tax=Arthrospiribacter ruber TaxID=2487934 RepID=A0A951J2W8_9BACT|nr:sensor histidine kinase [Arthrospiribacter ruber]MBW3470464.1 histidine kinase [Arthrospiribacter ruber]
MITFKKKISLHLLGIATFLLLPIVLSPTPHGIPMFNTSQPAKRDFLAGILMLLYFYLNYYILTPKLFIKKQYVSFALITGIAILTIILLPSLLTGYLPWAGRPLPPETDTTLFSMPEQSNFLHSVSHNILLFISVIFLSILLRVQAYYFNAEKAKKEMEIISLKEQINPHFLFNTLNNIYGQAIEDNATNTASSILMLSGLLRYVVHEAQYKWVTVKNELAYLDNYIKLQKGRLGKEIGLSYIVTGNFEKKLKIAPLILIPFVENAFKHGINPDKKCVINISIYIDSDKLTLTVFNLKVNEGLMLHEKSGTGMKITKDRLEALYPNKHELEIEDEKGYYKTTLTVELHD